MANKRKKFKCNECNKPLFKKEAYVCNCCKKTFCAKHIYSYVDESNSAITNNSSDYCKECYKKTYRNY